MGDAAVNTREPQQVSARVLKADTALTARSEVRSRAWEFEDEFAGKYGAGDLVTGVTVMQPPFLPRTLEALVHQNNTLAVCIDAVVTNVHCSGYEIRAHDEEHDNDAKREAIEDFFNTPYPNTSFHDLRKKIGRDLEKTGNAYIEVMRNLKGELGYLRRVDPKTMRLVKLDDPAPVMKEMMRGGKKVIARVNVRERRYVQVLNSRNQVFFKEYGASRKLHATTGRWESDGVQVGLDQEATEIIHLTKDDDSLTPYGVPAWVPQMPSVLGSRKAEEHNLEFFDHGGIPPIMIFVNGGALTSEAADELRKYVQSNGASKHEIPVIEAIPTTGSMDQSAAVKVTVERFGSDRQNDSMFEKYDEKCEKRIRKAWRLPPLFIGLAEDYSFASTYASYLVAEAQIFSPERQEFDEMVNRTIMRELDPEGLFEFKSLPITVKDIENQLTALNIAVQAGTIGKEQLIQILNEMTNMEMRVDEDDLAAPADSEDDGVPPIESPEISDGDSAEIAKADTPLTDVDVPDLADRAFDIFQNGAPKDEFFDVLTAATNLPPEDAARFKEALMGRAFEDQGEDAITADAALAAMFVLAPNAHAAA